MWKQIFKWRLKKFKCKEKIRKEEINGIICKSYVEYSTTGYKDKGAFAQTISK